MPCDILPLPPEVSVTPMSLSDEDEVKVHAAGDIEEGELSSGEEGEIKGGCG